MEREMMRQRFKRAMERDGQIWKERQREREREIEVR